MKLYKKVEIPGDCGLVFKDKKTGLYYLIREDTAGFDFLSVADDDDEKEWKRVLRKYPHYSCHNTYYRLDTKNNDGEGDIGSIRRYLLNKNNTIRKDKTNRFKQVAKEL